MRSYDEMPPLLKCHTRGGCGLHKSLSLGGLFLYASFQELRLRQDGEETPLIQKCKHGIIKQISNIKLNL